MNKYDKEVEVDKVTVYDDVISIYWHGSIGFGQYDLLFDGDKIQARSEYMDKNDNKSFLKALLNDIVDKVEVVE